MSLTEVLNIIKNENNINYSIDLDHTLRNQLINTLEKAWQVNRVNQDVLWKLILTLNSSWIQKLEDYVKNNKDKDLSWYVSTNMNIPLAA